MSAIQAFSFQDQVEVRTKLVDGEPWFIAKDVCLALGLNNTRRALDRLDEDEKGITTSNTLGGVQSLLMVNESGLYNLIFGSRKEEAKAFRRWVTHEVLPSIRKTGSYSIDLEDEIAEFVEELGNARKVAIILKMLEPSITAEQRIELCQRTLHLLGVEALPAAVVKELKAKELQVKELKAEKTAPESNVVTWWREQQDWVQVGDEVLRQDWVNRARLYDHYSNHSYDHGRKPCSRRMFYRQLTELLHMRAARVQGYRRIGAAAVN